MKDRILKFLQNENKSYTQFAEEIGVQPSGISHILSGRNNPSLDFILKMLSKYPALSAEWILFGRGSMYKTIVQPTLFDNEIRSESDIPVRKPEEIQISDSGGDEKSEEKITADVQIASADSGEKEKTGRVLEKVLFFYSDKTFTEYRP